MAAAGLAMVVVLGVSVLLGLALVSAVRSEHDRRTATDWESAERVARRDTSDRAPDDRGGRESDDTRASTGWRTDPDDDRSTGWD